MQTAQRPLPGLAQAKVHPVLACSDVARSRDFYVGTLGLRERSYLERQEACMEAGDGTLLYVEERPGAPPARALRFIVPDVEAAMAELRIRGVRFEARAPAGARGVASAWTKDPDGHLIELAPA